jgi:heat shock protein HtpX
LNPEVWRRHALVNRLQSALLLATMAAFLALLGWLLWGRDGVVMLLGVGAMALLFKPVFSPAFIMRLYGAWQVPAGRAPELHAALNELARRADLPAVPSLYYLPSSMLNAFAVGTRNQAAIAVTDGMLRGLSLRELIGVLAHEISHIRNNDLWVMTLADLISRLTGMLSLIGQFLLVLNLPLILFAEVSISWLAIALLILAPQLSALAQLALSRSREFDADLNAARLTADPQGLARALAKLERATGNVWERVFLPGRRVPEPSLLRTHPPTEERIRRLLALVQPTDYAPLAPAGGEARDVASAFGRPILRIPRWHATGLWH